MGNVGKGWVRGDVRVNKQKGIWCCLRAHRGRCLLRRAIVCFVDGLVLVSFLLLVVVFDVGGVGDRVHAILFWERSWDKPKPQKCLAVEREEVCPAHWGMVYESAEPACRAPW